MKVCLGTAVRKFINVVTLGYGKIGAELIADKLGFANCGCGKREQYLNELGNCYKTISLVEEVEQKPKKRRYYQKRKSIKKDKE